MSRVNEKNFKYKLTNLLRTFRAEHCGPWQHGAGPPNPGYFKKSKFVNRLYTLCFIVKLGKLKHPSHFNLGSLVPTPYQTFLRWILQE